MQTKTSRQQSAQPEQRAVQAQPHSAGQRRSDPLGNAGPLLSLQRSHGNRYVQRLLNDVAIQRAGQARLTVSQPGDPDELEADRVAEEVMRMPVGAVARNASPDDDGLPTDAEAPPEAAAVGAVLQRQGSPLDEKARGYFEPRFGRAFDKVRVHTDAQANESARAIDALAYTSGANIVFGAGQYRPDTFAGRKLIAHELAHVVQQGAAPAVAPSVQASGRSSRAEGGTMQDSGGKAAAAPRVQRLVIPAPGAGAGVRVEGVDDDSAVTVLPTATYLVGGRDVGHVSFGDSQTQSLAVGANTSGFIEISASLHFFIDNSFPRTNDEYDTSLVVHWPVHVSSTGQLTIDDATPVIYGAETDQNVQLVLAPVRTAKGANYVSVTVTISSTTTHSRTLGLSIGLAGEGATGGINYGGGVSAGGRTLSREFQLYLVPPVMPPTIIVGPLTVLRTFALQFSRPGRDDVSAAEEARLIAWYQSLNATTRSKIQSGEEPIQLVGHASVPGGIQLNRELSNQREQAVERILRQFVGSRAIFNTRAAGEYEAQDTAETIEERRVDVEILETGETTSESEP